MRFHRFLLGLTTLLFGLSNGAGAGEGFPDFYTGGTYRLHAYLTRASAAVDTRVVVHLNEFGLDDAVAPNAVDPARANLAPDDLRTVERHLVYSLGLWGNFPGVGLDLAYGGVVPVTRVVVHAERAGQVSLAWSDPSLNDQRMVLSVLTGQGHDGGQAVWRVGRGPRGEPAIREFDLWIHRRDLLQRGASPVETARIGRSYVAHELGHGLGLAHSWLSADAVSWHTGALGYSSLMSYGPEFDRGDSEQDAVLFQGALTWDDAITAIRLYPAGTLPWAGEVGAILGRIVHVDGLDERADLLGQGLVPPQ